MLQTPAFHSLLLIGIGAAEWVLQNPSNRKRTSWAPHGQGLDAVLADIQRIAPRYRNALRSEINLCIMNGHEWFLDLELFVTRNFPYRLAHHPLVDCGDGGATIWERRNRTPWPDLHSRTRRGLQLIVGIWYCSAQLGSPSIFSARVDRVCGLVTFSGLSVRI